MQEVFGAAFVTSLVTSSLSRFLEGGETLVYVWLEPKQSLMMVLDVNFRCRARSNVSKVVITA